MEQARHQLQEHLDLSLWTFYKLRCETIQLSMLANQALLPHFPSFANRPVPHPCRHFRHIKGQHLFYRAPWLTSQSGPLLAVLFLGVAGLHFSHSTPFFHQKLKLLALLPQDYIFLTYRIGHGSHPVMQSDGEAPKNGSGPYC